MLKVMVVVAAIVAGCDSTKPAQPEPKPVAAPTARAPAPVVADAAQPVEAFEVTAKQLFADYQANEVRADDRYKGKLLRVSGRVAKIAKDITGDPYVGLATANEFEIVQAVFDDNSGLAALVKGMPLALRCQGAGDQLTVLISHCAFDLEQPRDPANFIPNPGKAAISLIALDTGGKELDAAEHKRWVEAAIAVRNYCSIQPVKADPLGDLWNTVGELHVQRRSDNFLVTVKFDDRRKAVHRGRVPLVEVDAKLAHIRSENDDARALCAM
ncbi:MAG: hypothetical protein ABI467_24505 [Kofleriaceae bacterium]